MNRPAWRISNPLLFPHDDATCFDISLISNGAAGCAGHVVACTGAGGGDVNGWVKIFRCDDEKGIPHLRKAKREW